MITIEETCSECKQSFKTSGTTSYTCVLCKKPMCARCEITIGFHEYAHRQCVNNGVRNE